MGKVVENFCGVELTLTPEAVYGEVSKEEALKAIEKAGVQAVQNFNISELRTNVMWHHAVELNYIQTSESTDEAGTPVPEGEALKEYIVDIIKEAFDAECLPELLRTVGEYPGKNLYAAFSSAERNLLKQ